MTVPIGIAVDSVGNVYVVSQGRNNAFKITTSGGITEIIDSTGDGAGNTLGSPRRIAVDDAGNAYVTGAGSDNVFKIGGVFTPPAPAVPALGPLSLFVMVSLILLTGWRRGRVSKLDLDE